MGRHAGFRPNTSPSGPVGIHVTAAAPTRSLNDAWAVLRAVPDPEVPVLSVVELGIIRRVAHEDGALVVDVTPTYSGCPAIEAININILAALQEAGFAKARVNSVLSPAWSTDDISAAGREKLLAYGIAPPNGSASKTSLLGDDRPRACPQCGSTDTALLSQFGSTACKALYQCQDCREPFDYFKCH